MVYGIINLSTDGVLIMNQDTVMQFAKEGNRFDIADLPKGFKLFKFVGDKYWRMNGDLNDDERTFLIAAPTKKHALAWAQVEFLACGDSSFESYQALLDYLKESEVDEDHDQYFQFEGYTDVGDDQYRSINGGETITKTDAKVLLRHQVIEYTNCYFKD